MKKDGFRPNEGHDMQFAWNSPAGGARTDYKNPRQVHVFKTLKELCTTTGQECHGILVDYDIFQNVKKADMANFTQIYDRMLFVWLKYCQVVCYTLCNFNPFSFSVSSLARVHAKIFARCMGGH